MQRKQERASIHLSFKAMPAPPDRPSLRLLCKRKSREFILRAKEGRNVCAVLLAGLCFLLRDQSIDGGDSGQTRLFERTDISCIDAAQRIDGQKRARCEPAKA